MDHHQQQQQQQEELLNPCDEETNKKSFCYKGTLEPACNFATENFEDLHVRKLRFKGSNHYPAKYNRVTPNMDIELIYGIKR